MVEELDLSGTRLSLMLTFILFLFFVCFCRDLLLIHWCNQWLLYKKDNSDAHCDVLAGKEFSLQGMKPFYCHCQNKSVFFVIKDFINELSVKNVNVNYLLQQKKKNQKL